MENELLTIDEYDITEDGDTQEVEVPADEVEAEIYAEITEYDMEVEPEETIVVDISEGMGWVSGDIRYHDSLLGVDAPNQHPITAISRLREELDEIERLKTIYSNKVNVANYYQWSDASYDEYGYFVSLVPSTSTIKICDGADIFGVVTNEAAFVGGQNTDVPRGNSYGLVVTSGLVDVRCELDVEVGDCVTSNTSGYAKKSNSNYGYKVLAKETKNGVEYAVIMLGVQADTTDTLGNTLNEIGDRVTVNEKNIVSAINVANQAYNKSSESATVSEEALKKALEAVLNSEGAVEDVDDMKETLASTNVVAAQAKAIAESAATSATSMREEAIDAANGAWSGVNELTRTLGPIASWSEGGVSGADYLVTKMNEGIATTYDVKTVEDDLEVAQNAIVRNGKELYSLMTTIDKYSVGEYSQAYGLTLEEAKSILEVGMIYVPTSHERLASGTKYHEEVYQYTDEEGNPQELTRSFTPGYLYQWGELESGLYGWITVDKNFNQTTEVNTSSMAVYFSQVEIAIGDDNNYGYWYTDGDEIIDIDGNSDTYKPYTLYKWNGDGWFAVATLAGNVGNRATSQVRQTANEVSAEVTNARGSYAGLGARLTNTESEVSSLASWKNGDGEVGEAIIRQEANDDGTASIVISTLQKNASDEIEASASLVLSAKQKEGSTESFLAIDADNINFTADDYAVIAENITLDGYVTFENLTEADGKTIINGANIDTGTITSEQLNTSAIKSENYDSGYRQQNGEMILQPYNKVYSDAGTFFDLSNGNIYTPNFAIDSNGNAHFRGTLDASVVYTGNLDATQITSGYIDAERIEAESITADKIKAGAITTDKLDTNAIQSEQYKSSSISMGDFEIIIRKNTNTPWFTRKDGKIFTGVMVTFYVYPPEGSGIYPVVTDEFLCTSLQKGWIDDNATTERYYCPIDISEYVERLHAAFSGINIRSIYSFSDAGTSLVLDKGVLSTKAMITGEKHFCFRGTVYTSTLHLDWDEIDVNGDTIPVLGDCYVDSTVSDAGISITARSMYDNSAELGRVKGSASWDDVVLAGNLAANSTSDVRVKNNIETFSDAYDALFDKLAPKRYKYISGTSDRYHTGFIAQEVVQAVEDVGLTTQDFAAVCLDFNDESMGLWRLRRDEFVALNTWQIQKLKTRVAELEEKIDKLEKKLKGENGNGTETTNS